METPTGGYKEAQLAYYEHNVEDYERTRKLDRSYARKARIISSALPQGVQTVVEMGAGSGLLTYFLYHLLKPRQYTMVDLSEQMVLAAKARLPEQPIDYIVGDAEKPDLPKESYDAVVGVDFVHHLSNPVEALSAWREITKPGGRLAVLETSAQNPLIIKNIGVEHEVRAFLNTQANLTKWAQAAGWRNVQVLPTPTYTPPVPAFLAPICDLFDQVMLRVPVVNRLCALWLITGEK